MHSLINSTIFKTSNSSVDNNRKTLSLFNKDWNTYKTNWQQGFSQNGVTGGIKSIFQSSNSNSVISRDQIQILRNWNNAVAHGCTNQETFNRIIKNADDNTKLYLSGLNKGKGSIEGLKNAQNAAKQSTIGLTIAETALNAAISFGVTAAIMFAIKGFDKLANSAKKASEAADKAFSETAEKVQKNEEESKSLDELVSRYKELKESESLDVDGRKEIKNIQNDIADLVGVQASNLDLVNGKLDDEIAKLNEISEKEAKKAYETATANYNNSKKSVDSAVGDDSFLFIDGYAYTGKYEKDAEKILQDAGFKNVWGGGSFFNNTLFVTDEFDDNMKELKGAQEKSDYLQSMIDVLEQNGQRATDLYSGLISQRDKYLEYVNNQQNAANSLVNSWISYSQFSNDELSKVNVNSLDSFEKYRQKMIDETKNDETIGQMLADGILSDKDLENAINNFFATSTKFSTWYEKWIASLQNSTGTEDKSFDVDTLTKKIDEIQNVYKTLKDAIEEYNKQGYISVDTFQSIVDLGADYLKYLVDENGNLKLDAQSLQELTIARVKDMVVAQKNKILDTADGWSTEADALNYLKANLDETTDSYDDLIEKKLQLLRVKWTDQLDENGNRVWSDEQIENTIAGLRNQFGSLDTVGNAAIKGIKSGFGMTGESAKDTADKVNDVKEQLNDLTKSEALDKLKYKFDQIEQGITKIDTALSLLNSMSDLTYEDDYIGKIEVVSSQLDLATSKAQLLQNEFKQLSAEQHDTADSSNELASRMKSTADSIAENQKQIIEYGKNITSYYMSALSAINSLSKNSIERATTLIDRNIKTLSEGGLTGLEFSFVPTVPQSAIEKQRNENQSLKNEMRSYYDSVAEIQKTALDLQYKEQMAENEKKRQEILKSLKEQQNDLQEHYATVEKTQETHNTTTQESQKQNDKAVVTEQKNTQTNSLNEVKNYVTQFQTIIQGFIDWLAQNPLHPSVEFANLNDIMNSTFIGSNSSTSLPTGKGSADDVINTARSYVGKSSFTHAGNGNTLNSKDYCQAFVASIYKQAGVNSAYSSADTAADARHKWTIHKIWDKNGKIDYSEIPVGACIYSQCGNDKRGHVSIYSGNGKIIEAGTSTIREVDINDTLKNRTYYGWGFNGGVMPKYAKGTNNFGIYGENYRTEFAINKKTGEWFEANEPTLVNTDEYDVVGEKTSAKIKQVGKPISMYATGTPISDPKIREMVKKASQESGVPANIILSVIDQESGNKWVGKVPDGKGYSYGYMQLYDHGALTTISKDRQQAAMTDPYSNILEGAKYLKKLYDNYNDWTKATSAYNQGAGNLAKYGINQYGYDVVARANSTAFVQAAQDLSSISTAVQAVSTDTSDISTNTDTIATKDMKTELQNIVDSTNTPTDIAKYQGDLLNYIKDNSSTQKKNNDEFVSAWEKLQAEDETAKSVLADYDKQLTDNRWSDNYNEIKDSATKYATSYAINTIKAQTDIQTNQLVKQYDTQKNLLDDILKYFRERKANGASADELKIIAQTYSEELQELESTSDQYVSTKQSETDYLVAIAERNVKYVEDQVGWQEKINEGLEKQVKLTSNVNDKLSLQMDIIDGNDSLIQLWQKQKENNHRNVTNLLNDSRYSEILKEVQSIEPWFDANGEFSAQYEADLARLGASNPKLVTTMKQLAEQIQIYKKAWYDADSKIQQTLDDIASYADEVYATRIQKITQSINTSDWILDMLGDKNFELRLEETNSQIQTHLDKTVEIKKQQEYINDLYRRGSITYEQFIDKSQTLQEDLQNVYTTIKSLLNSIKQIKIDAIQSNIDDLQDQLDDIQDAADEITDKINDRLDVLNDEKEELEDIQDSWDKVANAVKKVLSNQKELLEDEKESTSDYWDDRIEAIEKANEETDRNISLLEKQKELSEAKEQKTALIYQNGKITYQADPTAVQDAEYALAEEQRSIKQEKAKEALEEQKNLAIKNIEDQIGAIDKYQEKWDEVFDWYQNEINEQAAYDKLGADWMQEVMAQKTSILNQVGYAYKDNEAQIEGSIQKEIDALEAQEKAIEKQVKVQEKAINANIKNYNNQIKAINKTSTSFDELYAKIVKYFKVGKTDSIPSLITAFVENFNSLIGNVDTQKLTTAITSAITGISSSGTSSSSTESSSQLSFQETIDEMINKLSATGKSLENIDKDTISSIDQFVLDQGYSANLNQYKSSNGGYYFRVNDGDIEKYVYQTSDGRWGWTNGQESAWKAIGGTNNAIAENNSNNINNGSNISSNSSNNTTNNKSLEKAKSALKNHQNNGIIINKVYNSATEAENEINPLVGADGKTRYFIYKSGTQYQVACIGQGDSKSFPISGERFAKGTDDAPKGLSIINDGNQYNGELVNFRGGEQVIPADKSIKLIGSLNNLTESDLGKLILKNGSIRTQSFLDPFKQSLFDNSTLQNLNNTKQVDNSITISNINMYETENVNDFVKQLNRQLPLAAKKIKR